MAETVLSISLKEYKKEIEDLKGSLLGLKKGSDEYTKVLDEVRERESKLREVMADVKKTADASEDSMNGLKQKLKELKQEIGNEKIGTDRFNELSKSILETTDKLKVLEEAQGTFSRNVGNYESGVVSLKSQLKEITAQMAEMLDRGVSPTDEAFVELAKKAGDLKDAMADSNAVIAHYANDTKGLATVVDLAKTGAAAFGAYKGVLSAFGIENENVNNSLQTLVGITTTLNSLQTLQTALVDRASITYRVYHGVVTLASTAMDKLGLTTKATTTAENVATVATNAHTGAITAQTIATKAATVATNLFKKALIATGIGALVVVVGELVAHFNDLVKGFKSAFNWIGKVTGLIKEQTAAEKAQAEASKRHKQELDELAKKEKDLNEENIGLLTSFTKLKAIWDNLSSVQDRVKFVERYKNEMSSLGVEVNNVNDAERFFSKDGTQAFAKSIEIRARLLLKQQELMNNIRREEELVAQQAMGDALLKVQDQRDVIKSEIIKLSSELDKYTPKSTTTKTTTKTSSTTTKPKADISGSMEEYEKSYDEQIRSLNYMYDLLDAQGKKTTQDEIERISSIYVIRTDIIQKEIEDREKQLENQKIDAEQRKSIEKDVYDLNQELIDADREYNIEYEKLKVKLKEETLKKLNELTKKSIEEENKSFKSMNVVSIYADMLKDSKPEIANAIVSTLSVSDEDKEKILSSIEQLNSENLNKVREYQIEIENEEYEHQQRLIQIQKDALVEIGIEFGEDSEEYLNQKQLVYQKEEEAERKHQQNLIKIEAEHDKSVKNRNRAKLNSYLNLADGIASVMDNVAGIMQEDIQRQEEEGKISEEEAKKRFETVKAFQIAAATIDMFAGAVGGFMGAMQDKSIFPSWLRPVLGGVYATAALTAGAANISAIKSQQFGGGGSSAGGAARQAVNVDFSGVQVNPLLDQQADINRLTTLSETQPSEQRVYILQSDITDSQKQVKIRQENTTF